jgi:hypothetical protein
MKFDPGLDLVWVRGPVRKDSVDLRSGDNPISSELRGRVFDRSEIVDPHRGLPHVGPCDQPGSAAGRAITEGDHRVLVASRALLRVAAKAIGQALASRSGTEAEPLGEAII